MRACAQSFPPSPGVSSACAPLLKYPKNANGRVFPSLASIHQQRQPQRQLELIWSAGTQLAAIQLGHAQFRGGAPLQDSRALFLSGSGLAATDERQDFSLHPFSEPVSEPRDRQPSSTSTRRPPGVPPGINRTPTDLPVLSVSWGTMMYTFDFGGLVGGNRCEDSSWFFRPLENLWLFCGFWRRSGFLYAVTKCNKHLWHLPVKHPVITWGFCDSRNIVSYVSVISAVCCDVFDKRSEESVFWSQRSVFEEKFPESIQFDLQCANQQHSQHMC